MMEEAKAQSRAEIEHQRLKGLIVAALIGGPPAETEMQEPATEPDEKDDKRGLYFRCE